jgi:ATP-dependent Clp protease ATP-binding subunit ClpC
VIARATGIPVSRISESERERLADLEATCTPA